MLIKDLKNKNVMIWGMGAEGTSVKEYLTRHGLPAELMVYNDSDGHEAFESCLGRADVIIRSPGVSIYKDEFQRVRHRGIKVTSSSDLFLNEMRTNHPHTKVIGISGSKGKSTSVSMLYHILQNAGCKAALGGNIGKALIELVDDENEFVVGEFSSYQASDLTASPHIAMFTNLFSVHTDWHRGHDNYCRDKLHLAACQKPGDSCWINSRSEPLKYYAGALADVSYYNQNQGFHAEERELFWQGQKILSIDELKISGNHNLDNLAGVMSIVQSLGLDVAAAAESLKTFEPLPHRLQKVAVVDGVLFINDSISTAPEAAIGGMKSFDDNLAIISGGIENQQDYTEYARYIQNNPKVKVAVTLFQCGRQIADSIRQFVTREDFLLIEAENLRDGVTRAYHEIKARGGSLVLFSPTAPSFGYYKNFMERGDDFINIVNSLRQESI